MRAFLATMVLASLLLTALPAVAAEPALPSADVPLDETNACITLCDVGRLIGMYLKLKCKDWNMC